MSHNNGNGSAWVAGDTPNGSSISPLELESLTTLGDDKGVKNSNAAAATANVLSSPKKALNDLVLYVKLLFHLYPRPMCGAAGCLVTAVLMWAWNHNVLIGHKYNRNYMTHDYSMLEDNFSLQTAQVDHWCLFGGDDKCTCEDPTEANARSDRKGWSTAHQRNKALVQEAVNNNDDGGDTNMDVVFLGDGMIQAWDGRWLERPCPEGRQIAAIFNKTFNSEEAPLQGLALGIYGDRIRNILWRIQHDEMPPSLNPKVFWIMAGTNDLARELCSEAVVTLGIMRLAEEVHHHYPEAVVVIQGILPRSNHQDGRLEGLNGKSKYHRPNPTKRHTVGGVGSASLGQQHKGPNKRLQAGLGFGGDVGGGAGGIGGGRNLDGTDDNNNNKKEPTTTTPPAVTSTTTKLPAITTRPRAARTRPPSSSATRPATTLTSTREAKPYVRPATIPPKPKPIPMFPKASNRTGFTYQESGIVEKENRSPYPKVDFYLWPSIQAINKGLEDFCAKHDHLVYFDADDLVLGSLGNAHFKAAHKTIISELMPDSVHLSATGHAVIMGAIKDELQRIIYDVNESNDIETKKGSKTSSTPTDDDDDTGKKKKRGKGKL